MNAKDVMEQSETLQETASTLKDTARDWGKKAATKAKDAGAATDLYVHDHMWMTMGAVAIAAGLLGFVIGYKRD